MNVFKILLEADWVERIGWTLLHSFWQIALLAIVYAIISTLLRNRSANVRYICGSVTLFMMFVLPLGTYFLMPIDFVQESSNITIPSDMVEQPIGQPIEIAETFPNNLTLNKNSITTPILPHEFNETENEPALSSINSSGLGEQDYLLLLRPWLSTVTVVWLFGIVLFSLRPVWGWFHVRKLQHRGLSPLSEQLLQLAEQTAGKLGVKKAIRFLQSSLVEVPTVVGSLRPIILLPASAIMGLNVEEIELILAHELAHIRRHDYLVNLVQTVIEALLFYHPGMWWVSNRLRQERENCCDDIAISIGRNRAVYVQALARLEQQRQKTPATVLAATGGSLLARVRRLLVQPKTEFDYFNTAACFAGLTTLSLLVMFVGLTFATEDKKQGKETGEVETRTGNVAFGPESHGLQCRIVPVSSKSDDESPDITKKSIHFLMVMM